MRVYRLSKPRYKEDVEGLGAKIYGGRWNHVGIPCIYTSQSRSLALLEYAANTALEIMPPTLHMTVYEIPETEFIVFKEADLPADWKKMPGPVSARDLGTRFLTDPDILGLVIPSIIVPEEYNYIINPESRRLKEIKIDSSGAFIFDKRIKR